MLVIDRRDDKGAYAPGANRAKVQAELEKYHFQSNGLVLESTAVPAQVVVENESQAHPPKTNVGSAGQINNGSGPNEQSEKGVFVVTSTPGPQQLLGLLLQRVWGVVF